MFEKFSFISLFFGWYSVFEYIENILKIFPISTYNGDMI